jgi:SAM-dependent methyltransferase
VTGGAFRASFLRMPGPSRPARLLGLLGLLALLALAGPAATAEAQQAKAAPKPPTRSPDVIFVPTPQEAVEKMLEMAGVKKTDKVYDLGCGDGRIVVTAARKFGARGVGVDIDPERIRESRANVKKHKVGKLVTIRHADIFRTDFSDADVVTLYLLPELNVKLMPKLARLKPGTRIVSYDFDMRGAKPAETYKGMTEDGHPYTIYKWVVPWEKEKDE